MSNNRFKKPTGEAKPQSAQNEEQPEKIFPGGVKFFEPHQNAPDFVLCEIVISIDQLAEWIEANRQSVVHESEKYGDQLKLTVKRSKGGAIYPEVNTYGI